MKYENVILHNVCDILPEDENPGLRISRLPAAILNDINPGAAERSSCGTGCEIRGIIPEGGEAKVTLQLMDKNTTPPVVTVYHGCFCRQAVALQNEPTELTVTRPDRIQMMQQISREHQHAFDPDVIRVRLPSIHPVRVLSIEGDWELPRREQLPPQTLLCYGSSITHGACACAPEGTYAAHCARRLGADLINLGFGGSAHMDVAIAEHIASRTDWDIATFEMGINVRKWPLGEFHSAVERFVDIVATAQPEKHIFCIDLFTYFADFEVDPEEGRGFRNAVQEIVSARNSRYIHHVDGRTILASPSGLRTDMVHPNDEGMQEMGQNLSQCILSTIANS